jgi:fumarylpyruvate hydrolase
MGSFIFPPPKVTSVAIHGTADRFPVRRIICVGRNYAAHAREMGKDPDREPPFFFFKPSDTLVDNGGSVPYPPLTTDLQYEIELVVAIGLGGTNIDPEEALAHVYGYAVGIDLTRRDLQMAARDLGRPWDWGKGFDLSAPCGAIHTGVPNNNLSSGRIWLAVNGSIRQDANISDLIWPVPNIISLASQAMSLQPGDLIYTGTPSGVGPVVVGDKITAGIEGLADIAIDIAPADHA